MLLSNNNVLSLAVIAITGTWTGVSAASLSSPVYQGCFSAISETISADWVALGSYIFQDVGYCEIACYESGYSVFGLIDGNQCLCGSVVPPSSDMVDTSNCELPCNGYLMDTCGGYDALDIYSLSDLSSTTGTPSSSDVTITITGVRTVPASSAGFGPDLYSSGIGILLDGSSTTATATATALDQNIAVTAASGSLASSLASSTTAATATPDLQSSSSSVSTSKTTVASPTSTGAAAGLRVQGTLGVIAGLIAILL